MNINKVFTSNYIKSSDLDGGVVMYTMTSAGLEAVGREKQQKLVLYFAECEKGLVLNKTNATTIAKLYGENTEDWAGQRIVLYTTTVEFGGEEMQGIRVRAPKAGAKPMPVLEDEL